ncbi:MAG: permease prefix domain 1-containing protein [Actinomycetota bacterium]|nr:permease prefix domain 1-containing protein [Actinomycetota bacterium]
MARAEDGLEAVCSYVAQLQPDLVGRARTRRRIAEEVRGHLEEKAERYLSNGMDAEAAQRAAIEDFGPPQVVINSWAESKGIGVVTNFTRFGGLAGIVGALGFSAAMVWSEISWSFSIGWAAEVALTFGAFLAAGMVALYMRLRGKLGRYARVGFRTIAGGLVVGFGSSMLWFAPGGAVALAMLVAGTGFYLVGALRADVVPRGPLVVWATGFVLAVIVGFGGSVAGVDTGYAAMFFGYGLFDAGWVWLGTHLWNERTSAESTPAAVSA